jgi:sulfhydrogenase subunit alpha
MNQKTTQTVPVEEVVPDYVCKIEGHGTLNIQFEECRAPLRVTEGERLFEGFVRGRNYLDVPFIAERICGICPTVHCLSAICALENAMGIEVSRETVLLRKLLLATQIIQSHALHIFFLALPDYLEVESVLLIAGKYPEEFAIALDLKRFSDGLITTIGGRPVHPISPQVSGFDRLPSKEELAGLLKDAEAMIEKAAATVDLFGNLPYPALSRQTQYLACASSDGEYATYNASEIASSTGKDFASIDFDKRILETVSEFSTAKLSSKESESFMVGAQARLNINGDHLNPRAREKLAALPVRFPSYNAFHNNYAQAVETLHFGEEIVTLLQRLLESDLENARSFKYEVRAGYGVGACEAPRGTLYHAYGVDAKGIINDCNIITPTAQNLSNIEDDACQLLTDTEDRPQEERQHLIEMLIRAYDPCITCSVH